MLYFASFFCPCHPEKNQHFDQNSKKPCLGKCGHTICLSCVENSVHCPICKMEDAFIDRTINYGAMEVIRDCRSNILNVFKNKLTSPENYGSGLCSKCFTRTKFLRICLLCNGDICSIGKDGDVKLLVILRQCLLKVSQCVVCADCAFEYHAHPENKEDLRRIEKIDGIKFDSDARRITCMVIMDLLKDEVKNGNLRLTCKLRFMKLREATIALSLVMDELDGFKEGDCGYLGELIKIQIKNKIIENTLTETDNVFNGPVCECTRLYEELLKVAGKRVAKRLYMNMPITGIDEFAMGCPLDFKGNAEWRDKIYSLYLEETPPNIDYTKPINTEGGCELCIFYDYHEEIDQNTAYYRDHCMEIYENFWRSETPKIETLCFRCAFHLSYNLVGRCCEEVKERWQLKQAGLEEDELIEHQRRYGARQMNSDACKHGGECVLIDRNFWKYAVKLEIREKAYKIFKEQIDEATQPEILETLENMDQSIGKIDLREDTKEELLEKVARIDEILEEMKMHWDNFKYRMEE